MTGEGVCSRHVWEQFSGGHVLLTEVQEWGLAAGEPPPCPVVGVGRDRENYCAQKRYCRHLNYSDDYLIIFVVLKSGL